MTACKRKTGVPPQGGHRRCRALVAAVACSRLLLGLHYPTDVIISATICPLISYAVWCVWNACESAAER